MTLSKNKVWISTAVDHFKAGILGWVVGDPSAMTFERLWRAVEQWQRHFYVTDGWVVYPGFIPATVYTQVGLNCKEWI